MTNEPFKTSDDDYRREADRKWRERVDDRLTSLTTSEQVQNDRLDDLDEEIQGIKSILEGDPHDKKDNGLTGDLDHLQTKVNALWSLINPDALGGGGMFATVKHLREEYEGRRTNTEYRWKFFIAFAVALLSLVGVIVSNLGALHSLVGKKSKDPVGQMIDRVKHPKGRHIIREEEPVD